MEKKDIESLIEENFLLEKSRVDLEKMTCGAYCLHGSFGIGQLKGYDREKKRLIIVFGEGNTESRLMDPIFCIKKLEILQDDDMLVKFHNNPAEIRQKMKKSSIALLIEYLEKTQNHKASLGDIEKTFGRIVEEKNFKRWWNVTKKLIAKEPKLTLIEGNVTYLELCDEPVLEEDQLIQQFESVRDIHQKITIAEKFLSLLKTNESLKDFGIKIIECLSEICSAKVKRVTAADKFQACVVRDELAKLSGVNIDSLSPKLEALISECPNLAKICGNLQSNYYTVFLELITRVFPDEWEKLCFNILKNCNERLTNECIVYLKDNSCADVIRTTLVKWLKEKNLRAVLLQWIIKNRHAKKFEEVFSTDLMSCELLRAIFWAIDNEALLSVGKLRKIPLVELLNNDRTLIRDLLSNATEEIASDLAQTLLINQGIDNLSKKSLLARFIAVFPGIQELVLSANKAKLPQDISLKVSLSSLENKRKEYDLLIKEKIPANKKAIELAREHGDLSENSEYKMARQDQDTLLSRKAQLEEELKMAHVIDFVNIDTSMVSIGSVVKIRQIDSGKTVEYTILGAWDGDPSKNIISYKTSMAQLLLGKKEKEIVESISENHKETWQIESISAYTGH
ncbi:MAG: GreA/GreB family elongation factor [Puniceicoccales bacterium]|jgi:transcription elongation GreA/GreB family factor|nr:GreA/GreB family elongation factor [Puniceicoccales bacterium]